MEQKIELEIKMREGTTKLLAACKHQTQALEAAKNLLISNERMTAYMTELQKRKREISKNRFVMQYTCLFFIRFYFIHFSRLNLVLIILFWENTRSASENCQIFGILNHSRYSSM